MLFVFLTLEKTLEGVEEKKKKKDEVMTARCAAKAAAKGAPSGGTVMTRHDDDFDIWTLMNTVDTREQDENRSDQADRPADRAADGSDEASDAAAHGSSKQSSEDHISHADFSGWWDMEADSEAEDAKLWTKEEKALETEAIRTRLGTFQDVTWNSLQDAEFWGREMERMRKRLRMLQQQMGVISTEVFVPAGPAAPTLENGGQSSGNNLRVPRPRFLGTDLRPRPTTFVPDEVAEVTCSEPEAEDAEEDYDVWLQRWDEEREKCQARNARQA